MSYLRMKPKFKTVRAHQFADMEVHWHNADATTTHQLAGTDFQPLSPTQPTARPIAAHCGHRGIEYKY